MISFWRFLFLVRTNSGLSKHIIQYIVISFCCILSVNKSLWFLVLHDCLKLYFDAVNKNLPSLKLTFSHLKRDGWFRRSFPFGFRPIWKLLLLVSGRVRTAEWVPGGFQSCGISFWEFLKNLFHHPVIHISMSSLNPTQTQGPVISLAWIEMIFFFKYHRVHSLKLTICPLTIGGWESFLLGRQRLCSF